VSSSTDELSLISGVLSDELLEEDVMNLAVNNTINHNLPSKKKRAFSEWYNSGSKKQPQCQNIMADKDESMGEFISSSYNGGGASSRGEAVSTPTTVSLGSLELSSLDEEEDDSLLSGSLWSRIFDTPSPISNKLSSTLINNTQSPPILQIMSKKEEEEEEGAVSLLFKKTKKNKKKKKKKNNNYSPPPLLQNYSVSPNTTKVITMSEVFDYFTDNDNDDYDDEEEEEVDERQNNEETLLDYMYNIFNIGSSGSCLPSSTSSVMNVDWCINVISCPFTTTTTATTATKNHVNELPILGLPIVGGFDHNNSNISTRDANNNIAPRSRRRVGENSYDSNDDEQQHFNAQVLSSQSDELSSSDDKQSYESGLSTWGSLLDLDTPLATTDIEEDEEKEVNVMKQQQQEQQQQQDEHNNNSSPNNVESFTTTHGNVASTQQQQFQSVGNIKQPENELSSDLSTSLRLLPMEELVSTETNAVKSTSEGCSSNDNDSISINSSLTDTNIGILGIAPMCLHNNNLDNTNVGFMIYNNLDQESNTRRTTLSRMLCESFIIPSNIIEIEEMTKPLTTTTTTTVHTQLRQMVQARMKTKKNHTTIQSSATASIIDQSTIRRNKKSTHGSCLLPIHNNIITTTTTSMTNTTPTINNTNNSSPLTMAQSNKGDLQRAIRRHKRRNDTSTTTTTTNIVGRVIPCQQQQQQQPSQKNDSDGENHHTPLHNMQQKKKKEQYQSSNLTTTKTTISHYYSTNNILIHQVVSSTTSSDSTTSCVGVGWDMTKLNKARRLRRQQRWKNK
jgi:hypothetical protein